MISNRDRNTCTQVYIRPHCRLKSYSCFSREIKMREICNPHLIIYLTAAQQLQFISIFSLIIAHCVALVLPGLINFLSSFCVCLLSALLLLPIFYNHIYWALRSDQLKSLISCPRIILFSKSKYFSKTFIFLGKNQSPNCMNDELF